MVFDGLCGFCSDSVRMVLKMDARGIVSFTPIQSPYGRLLCTRYGLDPDDPSTFLFIDRGRLHVESNAILALMARMQRPWRWLAYLSVVPRSWRDAAYRTIARNRYRLRGRLAACMVPDAALRARFIEAIPPDQTKRAAAGPPSCSM
ncbi:thiol-disulfide oxidoreductase DCC family protein [Phreatobacter aquaticus]|nr:DCC1-like thiol-disulfide oxidoreductase family protein [Phreatobacter aquaticus]